MEYNKVKSAAKDIHASGPSLDQLVLDVLKICSDLVGGTLGPGGRPVLIERAEHGMAPSVTKDGVSVFKSLGVEGSAAQVVLEVARDASVRTATEAGDGTTTATILSYALVKAIHDYRKRHPRVSPQRIVRRLESIFRDNIEPTIKKLSRKVNIETKQGQKILHAVARVSANGDTALADAVLECFRQTGDEGNVTIAEASGPSRYDVTKIDGFMIPKGYEDSCGKFCAEFINDPGNQRVFLEKPVFMLYHGHVSEIQTVQLLMERIGAQWDAAQKEKTWAPHNVVLVATAFSESVLATLALNFGMSHTINVVPLLVPLTEQSNSQLQFLQDLAAVTGATVLNPLSAHPDNAEPEDLGKDVTAFEMNRFKSSIIGYSDEGALGLRIEELDQMLENPDSILDAMYLRERKAKLSGGIARLTVFGASHGELKEKRDRADDAVCAVRGAIKHGTLPGGGWTLLKLCSVLPADDICDEILRPAFSAPIQRLISNCGITDEAEIAAILEPILTGLGGTPVVYDFLEQKHVDPYKGGLLDSTPAVLEAIRTSVANASLLGTASGIVAFKRDSTLERSEAQATASFNRDSNVNEADARP